MYRFRKSGGDKARSSKLQLINVHLKMPVQIMFVSRWLLHFKLSCVCVPFLPSVLWRCWLGGRKGIRPVKNWVVGCWHSYLSGLLSEGIRPVKNWVVGCWHSYLSGLLSEVQTCICPSWCHCHSLSLASVKSWLFLPFWYRLTRAVPEKRAVKRVCLCVCVCIHLLYV